jgi:hypothetical protein
MKTKLNPFFVLVLCALLLSSIAQALEVLEPGYVVQTYSSYPFGVPVEKRGNPRGLTFGPEGNLYVSHWEDYPSPGAIYRISPDGTAEKWLGDLGTPRRIVWTGGTEYGDYLYLADGTLGGILRIELNGTLSTFISMSGGPHSLALDTAGGYEGLLYVATRSPDRIYSVTPSGQLALFSNFPGSVRNGHVDLTFDPGTDYGGLMYAAIYNTSGWGGVYSYDQDGTGERFAPAIVSARGVVVDPVGLFGGKMFIAGQLDFSGPLDTIWRAGSDESLSEFAVATLGSYIWAFTFGPDGAMYVPEYSLEKQTVFISRIIPYPVREVAVDIKPTGCPNPLNLRSGGVLPVAILGGEDFDVSDIDIASVRLAGVAPMRSGMEDVAGAVIGGNGCDCDESGADGFVDLSLKFKKQDIVEVLSTSGHDLIEGAELTLMVTAALNGDTAVEGGDCVVIVGKVPNSLAARKSDVNGDGMVDFLDFSRLAGYWLEPAL